MTVISSGLTAGTSTAYQLVTETSQSQATSTTTTTGTAAGIGGDNGPDQTAVSKMGKMLNKLRKLASTDPEAFKQTTQTIADNLAQSASEATDPMQKQAFTDMSAKFAEAAKTGDMESLQDLGNGPPQSGAAGSDTVTLSSQGKELAAQSGASASDASGASTGETQSGDGASQSGQTQSGSTTQSSGSAKGGGGAMAGGVSGGSSISSDSSSSTTEDIDDEIDKVKEKICKAQSKLDEAKRQADTDDMKAEDAKKTTMQLADLNAQLTVLENEKLQAQNESSSSSSTVSGGASMTTHS